MNNEKPVYDDLLKEIDNLKNQLSEIRINENFLKKRVLLLETVLENSRDGINMLDLETGQYSFMNSAQVALTGFSRDEILNISAEEAYERVHPDDRDISVEQQAKILQGEKSAANVEYRWKVKNGEYRWFSDSRNVIFNENGKPVALVGISRDITTSKNILSELIKAKESSEKNETELLKVQEIARLGSWYLDIETNEVTWTEELYKMYDFDPSLPPPPYTEHMKLFTPASWEILSTSLSKTRETGIPYVLELNTVRKDGTNGWMWVCGEAIRDENNRIIALWGAAQDITERKKAEKELIYARKKAEESDRLKTAFLQNISHEIRTPLNGIVGFSHLLQDASLTKEDINEYTEIILKSSNRLMETVGNILDISKIETGQIEVNIKSFSLNSLMSDLFVLLSKSVKTKNVILEYQNPRNDGDFIIESDEFKLNQILSNLISNALKFTGKGKVVFGYSLKNSEIEFYVKDSGIGIPDEMRDRIFSRFAQVNLKISRGYDGVGLGLPICQGLVELLGGKIWFESELNVGTTFFFTIPSRPAGTNINPTENKHISTSAVQKSHRTILIVEDDFVSYQLIKNLFSNTGFSIIYAENGELALDLIKKRSDVNLILMDIKMPKLNGVETLKMIKEISAEIPIIAQTAYASTIERDYFLQMGFDDFIPKPIDKKKLQETISKYLD